MSKDAISEIGFKAGIPTVVTITDSAAWPWVVQAGTQTAKFGLDKHAQILKQCEHLNVSVGDTIQIVATVGPNKQPNYEVALVARYTPPEGTEEYANWKYEKIVSHMRRCLNSSHTLLTAVQGLEPNMDAIQRMATGMFIESCRQFNISHLNSDPDDLPF